MGKKKVIKTAAKQEEQEQPLSQVSSKSKDIKKEEKKETASKQKQTKQAASQSTQQINTSSKANGSLTNFFKKEEQKKEEKPKEQWDYFLLDEKYKSGGMGFNTKAIHCGNDPSEQKFGSVAPPIDLSTTYAQPIPGKPICFDYARCGNPTRLSLERNLAALENAKYCLALNSGMSACVSIMQLLNSGDHVLSIDDVYGGTQRYLRKIFNERQGVEVTFIDFKNPEDVRAQIKANTKVVWAETPTNPTLKIFDIKAVAKICKEKGVLLVIDNTFFTPYLQNPLDMGADIVVHSITKYIGGHSDVVMGCICLNDKDLYDRLFFNVKSIGSGASPFDCYLALRGSKTLGVRMDRAMQNAQEIAAFLEKHPKCVKIIYPGLKSHPQYELNKKQARGPGAMMSFYIKGDINTAERFLKSVKIFTLAESLGGVESLIENPALMTHFSVPPEQRKLLGIDDNLIRISVGIEDVNDLKADLQQAFDKS